MCVGQCTQGHQIDCKDIVCPLCGAFAKDATLAQIEQAIIAVDEGIKTALGVV